MTKIPPGVFAPASFTAEIQATAPIGPLGTAPARRRAPMRIGPSTQVLGPRFAFL
jgi:hypothetical protein